VGGAGLPDVAREQVAKRRPVEACIAVDVLERRDETPLAPVPHHESARVGWRARGGELEDARGDVLVEVGPHQPRALAVRHGRSPHRGRIDAGPVERERVLAHVRVHGGASGKAGVVVDEKTRVLEQHARKRVALGW
jgi:hypothetical protein